MSESEETFWYGQANGRGIFPLDWGNKCQGQKSQFFLFNITHWLNVSLRPQANSYKNFNKLTNNEEEIQKILFL